LQIEALPELYLTDRQAYVQFVTGAWGGVSGWGKRPCQLIPSQHKVRLSLKQLPQWAKPLTLRARSFIAPGRVRGVREFIAALIVAAARQGELDPARLRMAALVGFAMA